jgi:TPR repeat protein
MSTILNRIKKRKDKEIFKDHPVAEETIAIKMQYLNGLALMMNVDKSISDVEKEFFIALIEGLGLEVSVTEDFISFAKDPDDEQIEELFEELSKTKLTKLYFVLDCYAMAYKDEKLADEEKELISMLVEMLNFDEEEEQLFNTIRHQGYKNTYVEIGDYFNDIFNDNASEEEAFKWYKLAAEQGDALAQVNLGRCYYDGNGVEENYYEAVNWYKLAAEQGDKLAQVNLGRCYYDGNGVEENYCEAVKWYKLAAKQGDADAQNMLGDCYYRGEGVDKNYEEALKWYRLAADQGDANAQEWVERLELGRELNLF